MHGKNLVKPNFSQQFRLRKRKLEMKDEYFIWIWPKRETTKRKTFDKNKASVSLVFILRIKSKIQFVTLSTIGYFLLVSSSKKKTTKRKTKNFVQVLLDYYTV